MNAQYYFNQFVFCRMNRELDLGFLFPFYEKIFNKYCNKKFEGWLNLVNKEFEDLFKIRGRMK